MNRRFRSVDERGNITLPAKKGELAVDEHVAAGRIKVAGNVDDFLAAMDKVRKKKRTA